MWFCRAVLGSGFNARCGPVAVAWGYFGLNPTQNQKVFGCWWLVAFILLREKPPSGIQIPFQKRDLRVILIAVLVDVGAWCLMLDA